MADAITQAAWRRRKQLGLIKYIECEGFSGSTELAEVRELLPNGCGKRLRFDSSHSPLCSRCWKKLTPEGREYQRLATQRSRQKDC